ncbi:thiamine/thiamine pyrophosphate ABC transporter permease ThiP [Defluviimonas sp. WL0075]|uniref:Thiamine/thiamine pyrophosphate ABC transporter permease ThiP n=1 Tax=Albidovulum sediminicola TaxID=2984331 RepID=A0ABT2YWB4_9RHOB|nr:thiamine/thiamine pyrophosphate ABC transporter permease ThiP [Defluviimonas sp. WL0075]MCV2863151.1 thiamine/thiamine pyrophosphate ABC transporter permease ThiP [Defluviimonas sp. WL0075]
MAGRAQPVSRTLAVGGAPAALLLLLTLGTLGAVFLRARAMGSLGPADWAAVRFTLWQALLSASLSTLLAVPVARALARRSFPGRGLLIALLGAPFILPVIVAVMGLLAVFGRAGVLNAGLGALGLPAVSIYGLQGVVLAHVFFNLPLATRLLVQAWLDIPAERFRLAASLGMGPSEVARFLERPMLRSALPGIFLAIFLICLTSFAVALTLGGGPRATTVELAIYQAFRFDFDLGRAAMLGLLQVALCLAASVVAIGVAAPSAFGAGLDRRVARWDASSRWLKAQDATILLLTAGFLLLPLAMITLRGLPALPGLPGPVWAASLRSLLVALASATLTLLLALPMALAIARARPAPARTLEALAMLPLATSPLVLGTGLFLLLRPYADPATLALPVTAAANATLALPFALRILLPAARTCEADFGRLADSLDLRGLARLRLLTLPRLTRPLRFAGGLAAALSMGDLGVIALFADPETATLPLQLYRLMAAYRMADAAGAAVLLLGLSFALFWIIDRGGHPNAGS